MPRFPPTLVVLPAALVGALAGVLGARLLPTEFEVTSTVALALAPRDPFADGPSVPPLGAASMVPLVNARPVVDSLLLRKADDVEVVAESVSNEVLRIRAVGPDADELETLVETLSDQAVRVQEAELQRFRAAVASVPISDPVNVAWLQLQLGPSRVSSARRLGPPVRAERRPSVARAALAVGSFAAALAWLLGRLSRVSRRRSDA